MSDVSKKQISGKKVGVRKTIRVPMGTESLVGEFISFENICDGKEHIAIAFGNWKESDAPLIRMHSECLTGDVFGSLRCDCGPQLNEAIRKISTEGGVLLYLRQEGRGIGLYNKLDAYELQDMGFNTYQANEELSLPRDSRNYNCAADMLKSLGLSRIRLLTNNPNKVWQLQAHGIEVIETVSTTTYINAANENYLITKQKNGHFLKAAKDKP